MEQEVVAAPELDPPEADLTTEMPAATEQLKAVPKQPRKGKSKGAAPAADEGGPSVAAHPRAVRSIARVKGWAGLAGFFAAGYLSMPTSTLAGAGLRALIAGVACYVAAWGLAVFVWRRLVVIEIKAREQELAEQVLKLAAQAGVRDGREGS